MNVRKGRIALFISVMLVACLVTFTTTGQPSIQGQPGAADQLRLHKAQSESAAVHWPPSTRTTPSIHPGQLRPDLHRGQQPQMYLAPGQPRLSSPAPGLSQLLAC